MFPCRSHAPTETTMKKSKDGKKRGFCWTFHRLCRSVPLGSSSHAEGSAISMLILLLRPTEAEPMSACRRNLAEDLLGIQHAPPRDVESVHKLHAIMCVRLKKFSQCGPNPAGCQVATGWRQFSHPPRAKFSSSAKSLEKSPLARGP